jgi:hypothetical protein
MMCIIDKIIQLWKVIWSFYYSSTIGMEKCFKAATRASIAWIQSFIGNTRFKVLVGQRRTHGLDHIA